MGHDVEAVHERSMDFRWPSWSACPRMNSSLRFIAGGPSTSHGPLCRASSRPAALTERWVQLEHQDRVIIVAEKVLDATARIGISSYPHDGLDEQILTRNTQVAMYLAKMHSNNNLRVYSESLIAASLERLVLQNSLRQALINDEFKLAYQAQTDITSGCTHGRHSARETLAYSARERTHRGAWLPPLTMAVNLIACQLFDENLLSDIESILKATAMDPQ